MIYTVKLEVLITPGVPGRAWHKAPVEVRVFATSPQAAAERFGSVLGELIEQSAGIADVLQRGSDS